ncbi:unnamed protein product [Trichogramma brassicae]|uniref:Uncharacterized protein n=1 Tax=Trichogramma brassicae TaxID=86971 RepID=A0A6H5IDZ4_9HYME|nr:unnamed protein product [Trichogramma brassicae]
MAIPGYNLVRCGRGLLAPPGSRSNRGNTRVSRGRALTAWSTHPGCLELTKACGITLIPSGPTNHTTAAD